MTQFAPRLAADRAALLAAADLAERNAARRAARPAHREPAAI